MLCIFLYVRNVYPPAENFTNCTNLFDAVDTNGNGLVGFHEIIAIIAQENFYDFQDSVDWELKLQQIDCKACLKNISTYYL